VIIRGRKEWNLGLGLLALGCSIGCISNAPPEVVEYTQALKTVCSPGSQAYCNYMGTCNSAGTACVCTDFNHRKPEDRCAVWYQVIIPPGQMCVPGSRYECSWKGTCESSGMACKCDYWWHGPTCEIPASACPGWGAQPDGSFVQSVCSDHGRCVAPNQCQCDPGFSGSKCGLKAPTILVTQPPVSAHPSKPGVAFLLWDVAKLGNSVTLSGHVEAQRRVASLTATVNEQPAAVTLTNNHFSLPLVLTTQGPGAFIDHTVRFTARDSTGLTRAQELVIRAQIHPWLPGLVQVRFHTYTTDVDVERVAASVQGRIARRYRAAKLAVLEVDHELDPSTVAMTLSTNSAVAYATTLPLAQNYGLCDTNPATSDPQLGTAGQYYLRNDPDFIVFGRLDTDAPDECLPMYCKPSDPNGCHTGETCLTGFCTLGDTSPQCLTGSQRITCANDTDCINTLGRNARCSGSQRCTADSLERGAWTSVACQTSDACTAALGYDSVCEAVGICGMLGAPNAASLDIGYDDAAANVCSVLQNGPEVTVAVIEDSGTVNPMHEELQRRMWINYAECGGPKCTQDSDCGANGHCIDGRVCDGPDPDLLPDCVQGDANHDGCPGVCGVDDDGDGFADWDDPEVKELVERLLHNGIDDDGDGVVDDGRPAIPAVGAPETGAQCANTIDDDGDGVVNDGCPGIPAVGASEAMLAAEDDDENGLIDDIYGFDFARANREGERNGSTHPLAVAGGVADHATMVAGAIAAQLDNGRGLAGINPRARIITLTSDGFASFVPALRYAEANGARVVNMSWGLPCGCGHVPCTGDALARYNQCVTSSSRLFADAMSPSILYVMAAGNEFNSDLTTEAIPDANGRCTGVDGNCFWHFPQNIGSYLDQSGNPISPGTGSPYKLVITATDLRDRLVEMFLGTGEGNTVGSLNASGTSVVDFAAPSNSVDVLRGSAEGGLATTGVRRSWGGTSFSSPVVAGVASTLMARFPDRFDRNPAALIQRLQQTVKPCQAPAPGGRTCEGNMHYPGRVDLARALDTTAFPFTPLPLFVDESWRLNNTRLENTHDIDFIIDNQGGIRTVRLLEVFGGPFTQQAQPRLYEYDAATATFHEVTYGADNAPGGTGANADRLPDLVGNYNKSDVADFDGDGCSDLVLAGFFQQDPAPGAAVGALAGERNRLLFQVKSGGTCSGRFVEVTDDQVGPGQTARMPTRADITRDVDALDIDNDGDLDLVFTNALLPEYPGGTYPSQVLINQRVPTGTTYFVDESWRLPGGLAGDPHQSTVIPCDINGDQFPDIIQASFISGEGRNALLINKPNPGNGGGRIFVDESEARHFPTATGFSHDVACHDFTGDGKPEILFARRTHTKNIYLLNDGNGVFTDRSDLLPDVADTTQKVAICDLDGDGTAEVFFGNGDIVEWMPEASRLLKYDRATGRFQDNAAFYGFDFSGLPSITEEIKCADLDGNGSIDVVLFGNTGQRNTLYRRR
jgi:hypothetical protein